MSTHALPLAPSLDLGLDDSLLRSLFDGVSDELVPFDADEPGTMSDLLRPSDELTRVARRIAGQYVGVLARHAAAAFGRGAASDGGSVRASVDALRRLATAAGDQLQVALLEEFVALLDALEGGPKGRSRQRGLTALSGWIPRFAATLEEEDARHLLALVKWERGSEPLMDELATLKGIGRRRLARLYAAGLFAVDVVANASPDEVAQVTGLPRPLAVEVVEHTRRFADDEQRRCLEELRDRARKLHALLQSVRFAGGAGQVGPLAQEARVAMEQALRELDLPRESVG
jgi:hypothetical protein